MQGPPKSESGPTLPAGPHIAAVVLAVQDKVTGNSVPRTPDGARPAPGTASDYAAGDAYQADLEAERRAATSTRVARTRESSSGQDRLCAPAPADAATVREYPALNRPRQGLAAPRPLRALDPSSGPGPVTPAGRSALASRPHPPATALTWENPRACQLVLREAPPP